MIHACRYWYSSAYCAFTTKKDEAVAVQSLDRLICENRGQKIMLDADLARIYGVSTGALNRAIKRNSKRFPDDFAFQLTTEEVEALRCQIGISKTEQHSTTSTGRGGRRYLPYAFTEHGAIMAANVLNSPRAFVKMRGALSDTRELAHKLAALEKELKERLDVHDVAIVTILQRVMDIIDPPARPDPPKKEIGFHAKEGGARYRVRSRR